MESISETIEGSRRNGLRHGWIPQVPEKRKPTYVLEVFRRNLRKYCETSSLVGYRYLVEPNRPWIERVIWMILHITTLIILGMVIRDVYAEYQNVPVVTVVESDNHESTKLEFPGIAICNINRISRKAATKLANEIVSENITDWELVDVLRMVKQLGNLYDETSNLNATADIYLDQIFKKYLGDNYDVTTVMKNLSPSCDDALSSCHFHGEAQNCSDIFVFRKTQHGFCCTFNYAPTLCGKYICPFPNSIDEEEKDKPRQPYFIRGLGITNGLSLVMEPFVEDYYYPILPIIGWKVTVFNARDYPDNGSGSVSEALLSPATETFVELDVSSFYSSDTIKNVEVEKRKCIFEDELPVLYTGYTYSDCLVDCRASAIWDTCECRPFYFPRRGNNQYAQKVCNTGDSKCLYSNREVYWTVLSSKVQLSDADKPSEKLSLNTTERCRNCYPACNDVRYYLRSSTSYLDRAIYHTDLVNNAQLVNQSIVHIYFTKHGSVRLQQVKAYYWYELLSNIGGICGVFVSFSLISVVELLYFAFYTLVELWHRNTRIPRRRTTTRETSMRTKIPRGTNKKRFNGTLYWNEFLSHSSVTKYDGRIQTWRY